MIPTRCRSGARASITRSGRSRCRPGAATKSLRVRPQRMRRYGDTDELDSTELAMRMRSCPEGARGRLELGLRSMTSSGLSLDFAGSYDGIGSSAYEAWAGRASASVPLN